jgi:hypothetical protein
MREGFDAPVKLALQQAMGGVVPRVAIHRKWAEAEQFFE